jgi:myo-inositol 2-dehydrogenase/D-chiro-inositol 1-dehydrogenase
MTQIKTGLVGLGRLGKKYARIISESCPSADLCCICSIHPEDLRAVGDEYEVNGQYASLEEMLKSENLDALVIASTTTAHVSHILQGLSHDLHIFSEKPLCVHPDEGSKVLEAQKRRPDKMVMIGFNRRFDPSYQDAYEKVSSGLIGDPFLFRSQTVDVDTISSFQVEYSSESGGIFHDYNIHDIDLARWFLNDEIEDVWSIGGAFKHPQFGAIQDCDYAVSTCSTHGGRMAVLSAGRIATHGHHTFSEITGTEGTITIGLDSSITRLEIRDKFGIRKESAQTFWDRFHVSFGRMLNRFFENIEKQTKTDLNTLNALRNTEIATAMTLSFRTGNKVTVKQTPKL